ncbi:MAG: asparaginase [Rhodospirillaceae bacterium]|nr:asparaginase [Rhodospirillaceae bacterium]
MNKPEKSANPVMVEVIRGTTVESRHRGCAIAMNSRGETLAAWGKTGAEIYPRSAIKMLQALVLVESGAADNFDLSNAELALATASHNGAVEHVNRVIKWLERIGLDIGALECGAQEPMGKSAADDLIKQSVIATAVHNNCSGKHAGFLTTALHMGAPLKGYVKADHPVQQRVRSVIEEMCGVKLASDNGGIDGCNIPAFLLPLDAFARGLAAMLSDNLSASRKQATKRILEAMAEFPELVAGRGRFDTRLMQATNGAVISKTGAEGVQVALVPADGVAIVIKCDDGAKRAAEVAMAGALQNLGLLSKAAVAELADVIRVPLFNRAQNKVGEVRASDDFIQSFRLKT